MRVTKREREAQIGRWGLGRSAMGLGVGRRAGLAEQIGDEGVGRREREEKKLRKKEEREKPDRERERENRKCIFNERGERIVIKK